MSQGCVQTYLLCIVLWAKSAAAEGGGRAMGRLCLCLCTGRNFPEVQRFCSIRASRAWPPARLGSSRNSTVPSVGFLTPRWSKTLESPGKREKTGEKNMLRVPRVSPSYCLPSSLTSAGRDDGSGSVNTLLFHLMPGVACEWGRGAALLVALLLQR